MPLDAHDIKFYGHAWIFRHNWFQQVVYMCFFAQVLMVACKVDEECC